MLIFLLTVSVILWAPASPLGEDNFTAFEEMVLETIAEYETYVVPTDNSASINVTDHTVKYFGTFDFIIVGSGAAGSVLANRLTEISDWNVLLLEAGGVDNDFSKILGLFSYLAQSPYNWGYSSVSQEHGCLALSGQCPLLHGRGLGGSTNTNAAIYSRGHPEDFQRWVQVYGNVGWSYEEVLPYFKKSENATFGKLDDSYHSRGGYLTVSEQIDTPMTGSILKGFEEIGYRNGDYNQLYSNTSFRTQTTFKGNERVSTSTAFLKPVLQRPNLLLSVNSFVTKINIDPSTKTAFGVQFVKDGQNYTANVTKDVILSAGGYNSAQLLLLSGVGPKAHLEELGIPVIADLPVGQNVQEHVLVTNLVLRTNQTYGSTFNELLERYVNHLPPLINIEDTLTFVNFDGDETRRPDVEFLFVASTTLSSSSENQSIAVPHGIILLHPKSRGNITLQSNNPKDFPLIDYQMLAEDEDVDTFYRAIQEVSLAFNDTEALKSIGGYLEEKEFSECLQEKYSKEWWYCTIRYSSTASYHPIGANSMGSSEENSVVNARGRVHGFAGLRVADESIIPESGSGHNMAPTIMIAERISDLIKEDYSQQV